MNKLILLSVMILFCFKINAQTIQIDVDLENKYQTIDNFSASDCWWAHKIGNLWSEANKDSIADLLFTTDKGIGLSAWRFNLGAGLDFTISDFWRTVPTFESSPGVYDWTKNKGAQWFLNAAKERGVDQFLAFVNSPPKSMTRNGHTYCSDGNGSTNLKDGYHRQFAKYMVDILKHFRDSLDIQFDHISPVNEPQWEWNGTSQEGNRASNDDIKQIVDSLYTELDEQGVESEIVIPESGELPGWYSTTSSISNKYGEKYGDYLTELFDDADIVSKTGKIFAGHSYWSDRSSSELVQTRQTLYNNMSPYFLQGYKYWATEYCILEGSTGQGGNGRDLSITTALEVARIIHYDLTTAYASAWQWWLAVSKYDYKDGLIYTNYGVTGNSESIIPSKTLWALGNYSRYIRPGSVRIGCNGANNKYGLMSSAYVDSALSKVIIVFVNIGNKNQEVSFNFTGLDNSKEIKFLSPYVTTNSLGDDLKQYPAVPIDSTYMVPAKSIVTMVGMLDGSEITKVIESKAVPDGFKLYQNYPNPFNPETKIRFSVNKSGFHSSNILSLKVYDSLGKIISTLVNEYKAPGQYEVSFNGVGLPSGVYYYNLKIGSQTLTKKMLLLK